MNDSYYGWLTILLIPGVIGWLVCAVLASTVASDKGQGGFSWFVGGILFGPLALIAVAGSPDLKSRKLLEHLVRAIDPKYLYAEKPDLWPWQRRNQKRAEAERAQSGITVSDVTVSGR